jgi:nucleoside-diphosphate-sugar epimerase
MFYAQKRVVVTGGASFIGSHVVDALIAAQASVTVVDDLSSGRLENLQMSMPNISFMQGDLRDPAVADEATKGQDLVFHLANIHGGRGFIDTHPGDIVQNFIIDGNVFYYAHRNRVQRICYTSSACVYPVNLQSTDKSKQERYLAEDMADPFTEGAAFADGEYGWGKLMGEMALQVYHKQYHMQGVSCRLFTVYGPRENESHAIIALIAKALLRQDPYEIWGSGQQERNFTYVTDVVTGLLLAAEKTDDCRAVNIGTDEIIKIRDAAAIIMKLIGHRPQQIFFNTAKPEGVHTRAASIQKQQEWLGWHPQVAFAEGIQKTIAWYQAHADLGLLQQDFDKRLFERAV